MDKQQPWQATTNRTSNDLGKPRVNTPHVEHVTTSRELSTPLGVFESIKADHAIIVSSRNDIVVVAVGLAAFQSNAGEGVENCKGKASGRCDGGKGERRATTVAVVGEREVEE